jgi:hypothetical protein
MRRCRYRPARPDPYTADVVRRLRGLLVILRQPSAAGPGSPHHDDELLDRLLARPTPS